MPKRETIELDLTWRRTMSVLIMVLEHGTDEGKAEARRELMSLAEQLDEANTQGN